MLYCASSIHFLMMSVASDATALNPARHPTIRIVATKHADCAHRCSALVGLPKNVRWTNIEAVNSKQATDRATRPVLLIEISCTQKPPLGMKHRSRSHGDAAEYLRTQAWLTAQSGDLPLPGIR